MYYQFRHENLDAIASIINNSLTSTEFSDQTPIRLMVYTDRSSLCALNVIMCPKSNWITNLQFMVSAEHIKGNIDIIAESWISKDCEKELQQHMIKLKEYREVIRL